MPIQSRFNISKKRTKRKKKWKFEKLISKLIFRKSQDIKLLRIYCTIKISYIVLNTNITARMICNNKLYIYHIISTIRQSHKILLLIIYIQIILITRVICIYTIVDIKLPRNTFKSLLLQYKITKDLDTTYNLLALLQVTQRSQRTFLYLHFSKDFVYQDQAV